jgi:hypothetical protein
MKRNKCVTKRCRQPLVLKDTFSWKEKVKLSGTIVNLSSTTRTLRTWVRIPLEVQIFDSILSAFRFSSVGRSLRSTDRRSKLSYQVSKIFIISESNSDWMVVKILIRKGLRRGCLRRSVLVWVRHVPSDRRYALHTAQLTTAGTCNPLHEACSVPRGITYHSR